MTSRIAPRDRRGFALISVLWIVVLIAVVGLDFSVRARGMTRRVINAADHSTAREAAEAGLLFAEDRLVRRLREVEQLSFDVAPVVDPWQDPATLLADTLRIGEALCVVRLEDAGTKVHLNQATEQELRRLMTAVRIDDGEADRVAQAILDWRDLDDFRRARGAEKPEYVQAEAPVLPANGPFGSVEDVRQVMGVTEEIYARVAPFLTVEGSGRVNVSAAPAEVLAALPGMSDGLMTLILRARARGGTVPDLLSLTSELDDASREAFQANLPALLMRAINTTQEVLVTSWGWSPGSAIRVEATAVAVRARDAVFVVDRSLR